MRPMPGSRPSGCAAGSPPRASRSPRWPPTAGAYEDRRLAQAAGGELRVTVDHADLLVLP